VFTVSLDIGVLGLASYYGPAFARRIAGRSDCTVVAASTTGVDDDALAALTRPTAGEFADAFDCPVYDAVEPTLDAADAVVAATATTRRADDTVRALERGRPVLCAKPVAASSADARRVANAAARSDAPVVFTTPARYDDAIATVGRKIAAGDVGEVLAVRADIRHDRVPPTGIEANAEHAPGEAGSTHAMAVYVADALLWFAPSPPTRVSAEYVNANTPHSAHPDLGTATVRFGDDVLGTMTMTYSTDCREAWGNWEVEVVGTDGVLRTAHQGYEGVHWTAGGDDDRSASVFGRSTSPVLDRTLEAFLETVDGTRPERTPTADRIAAAHALCDAWRRAADEGPRTFESWPPAEY
jgi:predicted dehydrogenase